MWGAEQVGARHLRSLVAGLPADSAFVRRIDPAVGWTAETELLAGLVELTDRGQRWWAQAHSSRGTRQPQAVKIRRPWTPVPERRKATADDLKKMFGGSIRYAPEGGEP